jgi:hypothetical protein
VLASQIIKNDIERKHLLIMETERLDAIAEANRLVIIKTATASIIDDAAAAVTQARSSLLVAAKVEAEEKRQALLFEEYLHRRDSLLIPIIPNEHKVLISSPAINSVRGDTTLEVSQEEECLRFEAEIQDLKVSEESQISNISAALIATDSFIPITTEVEALLIKESDPYMLSLDIAYERTALKGMDDNTTLPVVYDSTIYVILLMVAPFIYMIAQ